MRCQAAHAMSADLPGSLMVCVFGVVGAVGRCSMALQGRHRPGQQPGSQGQHRSVLLELVSLPVQGLHKTLATELTLAQRNGMGLPAAFRGTHSNTASAGYRALL